METEPAKITRSDHLVSGSEVRPGGVHSGQFQLSGLHDRNQAGGPQSAGREPCATFGRARRVSHIIIRVPTSSPSELYSNSQIVNLAINPLIPLGFVGTGATPCTRRPLPRSDVAPIPRTTILSRGRRLNRTRGELPAAGRAAGPAAVARYSKPGLAQTVEDVVDGGRIREQPSRVAFPARQVGRASSL